MLCVSCGDLSEGPVLSDARFSRTFRYYYVTDCSYDRNGIYGCSLSKPISPSYVVRIRVDGVGDASLNLDGESYFFRNGTFEEKNEGGDWFFEFREGNEVWKIYQDGTEIYLWDTWNSTVTIYSNSYFN